MTVTARPRSLRSAVAPQGAGGVLLAVLILLLLLAAAAGIGWLLSSATAAVWPSAPPYMILVWGALALLLLTPLVGRAFPWIRDWFYLFPALVFVLAFTVLPVVLTVNYAFTNYSGENSGNPDSAARTAAVLSPDRLSVRLPERGSDTPLSEALKCRTPSCVGDTLVLYDEDAATPHEVKIASIGKDRVTLAAPAPAGLDVAYATRINRYQYVGLANFQEIFAKASRALWPVFVWTVAFAFFTVILNALAGLILGILLYNKRLKGRNIYRTLLFLPWAIPAVISVQMWKALLDQNFGIVNKTLGLLGLFAVPWLNDPLWAKISILFVNR